MLQKNLKLPLVILCGLALLVILAPAVQAQSFLPSCVSDGYCSLCHMLQLVINFGKFLLGLVGSLALLMFVYGGFVWLTSGGESGKIDQGKKILINSVIGIGITFFAWVVVSFVVTVLTASTGWSWNVDLTCAKLPGLEPAVVDNRDPAGSSSKKEGEACGASPECETNLYCQKNTKVCAIKLPTSNESKYACVGMELNGKDNLACDSGDCLTMKDPLDLLLTDCDIGQCCHSGGTQASGTECFAQNCAEGLYCQVLAAGSTKGKCVPKNELGQSCDATSALRGDDDDMCKSDNCKNDKCEPGTPIGVIGEKCKSSDNCKPEYYCKANTASATEGLCVPDLAVGQSCVATMEINDLHLNACGIYGTCIALTKKCAYKIATFKGLQGEYCTYWNQCATKSCKCPGDDTKINRDSDGYKTCSEGTCEPKIPKGNTSRYCDDYEASLDANDDFRCESGDCLEYTTEKCDAS